MAGDKQGNGLEMGSGLTPAWAILAFVLGCAVALPVALVVIVDKDYDLLRYIVSAQIFLMISLYFYSMIKEISHVLAASPMVIVARTIWLGRITRYAGLMVLLMADLSGILDRVGSDSLSPTTPASQLAVIILLVSWFLLDRKPVTDMTQRPPDVN